MGAEWEAVSPEIPSIIRRGLCAVRFTPMAMIKLSSWSACRCIRSDLGHSGAKYVSLYQKEFVWK